MFARTLPLLAVALLTEAAFGYPPALFRVARHPVVWIGALIAALDARLPRTQAAGVLALAVVLAATILAALAVARAPYVGGVFSMLLAAGLFAQRSLHDHVRDVADALDRGLDEGRAAVARIVGREVRVLDEAGVARAAIESLAENFSDGVIAPALWFAIAGLPGIAAYKAVNTADSMIGHRTPRHAAFGWASARLDDALNLPAARLSAALIALAAGPRAGHALRAAWRDAPRHRSPNAGWPEAAMAAALGLRLAGPRVYAGARVDDAWIGDGRAEATASDIRAALVLYRRTCAIHVLAVAAFALIAQG